jgi:hypothetical protein
MDLDEKKIKELTHNLWDLWNACRFIGYHLTKNADRDGGLMTIDDICGYGNWKALRSNTQELEANPVQLQNALIEIDRFKEKYRQTLEGLDYFEGVLKKASSA